MTRNPSQQDPNDPFNGSREPGIGDAGSSTPPPATTPPPPPPADTGDPVGDTTQNQLKPTTKKGSNKQRAVGPTDPALQEPPTTIIPPKPTPPISPQQTSYAGRGAKIPVIYGEVSNVPGLLVYWKALDDGRYCAHYIVSYGPVELIDTITFSDRPLSDFGAGTIFTNASTAGYETFFGDPNQAVSQIFTLTDVKKVLGVPWIPTNYPGLAHVIILFPASTTTNPHPSPDFSRFNCRVKGMKIRTSGSALTARYFSENPSYIIADLLTARFGGKIPDTAINWNRIDTENTPYHDELLYGGVKRHSLGISISSDQNLETILENLRAHAQIFLGYNNGQYEIIVDKPRAWSGIEFLNEDTLEGSKLTINGSSKIYTHITVNFTDSANKWAAGIAEAELPSVPLGTDIYNPQSYDLRGLRTYDLAKRISIYLLNRSQQDKTFSFSVLAIGAKAIPGDVVKLTDAELNLSQQLVIITDGEPDGANWKYTAELYDPNVYYDIIETRTVVVIPPNPSPYDVPPPPTNLLIATNTYYINPDTLAVRATLSFVPAPDSTNSRFTRIRWRATGIYDTGWSQDYDTSGNQFILNQIDVQDGLTYTFELKTVTRARYSSTESLIVTSETLRSMISGGDPFGATPNPPVSLSVSYVNNGIYNAVWLPPPILGYIRGYELRVIDESLTTGLTIAQQWARADSILQLSGTVAQFTAQRGNLRFLIAAFAASLNGRIYSTAIYKTLDTSLFGSGTISGTSYLETATNTSDHGGAYVTQVDNLVTQRDSNGKTVLIMFARNVTAQQIQDEYFTGAAGGVTDEAGQEAMFPYIDWAPLPMWSSGYPRTFTPLLQTISSTSGCSIGGTANRNYIGTLKRTVLPRLIGQDVPDFQGIAIPQWRDGFGVLRDGPVVDFGPSGYRIGALAFAIKLGTNNSNTQVVLEPNGDTMFSYTLDHYDAPIIKIQGTTNAQGEITITYNMPTGQWPEIRARITASGPYIWVLKAAPTETSATVVVYNTSGVLASGISIEVEAIDTGRGGSYSSVCF